MIGRPHLLKILHRNSMPDMSIVSFAIRFGEFEFLPLMVRQEIAGVVAIHEGEIHMALEPQYRRSIYWRQWMVDIIQPMLDEYGFAYSQTLESDTETHNFLERLGFKSEGTHEGIKSYRLSELKLRRSKCRHSH